MDKETIINIRKVLAKAKYPLTASEILARTSFTASEIQETSYFFREDMERFLPEMVAQGIARKTTEMPPRYMCPAQLFLS